ncbi:major facilitator superfamily domain-containing protein [Lanmaoa asiatica]|nr:major facilitator superfamily domain-containing protein [Lanmaoa asiatica]
MAKFSSTQSSPKLSLTDVVINPANLKCSSFPLFSLKNQYSINFHLLSWFAFSPLIPEVIKTDLGLTSAQGTPMSSLYVQPSLYEPSQDLSLIDLDPARLWLPYLVIGAIPSGLAGTVSTVNELYIVRFFIGILGGTFVPCQAWTTAFFDTNVVGTANAMAGGWGNAGGGVTFIIMIALFNKLVADGLTPHVAWRAAFAIVPVPVLLSVAAAILVFGTDHPAGRWSDRHKVGAATCRISGVEPKKAIEEEKRNKGATDAEKDTDGSANVKVTVKSVEHLNMVSELDVAVTKSFTWRVAYEVIFNLLTWLPAMAYFTTFGYELAIDANLANVLFNLMKSPSFGQTKAGYIAGIYGFLNVFSRPLGGYCGDLIYKKLGVPGKKYFMVALGLVQGLFSIGLGVYIDNHPEPSLTVIITLFVVLAIINEAANGVNFSLVPHCNPCKSFAPQLNGIVGAMGNLGGVLFAVIFRFQPTPAGKAFQTSGITAMVVNIILSAIPVPAL